VRTQIAFSDNLNKGKYVALVEQAHRLGAIRTVVGSVLVLLKALALVIELFGINGLKKAGNLMSAQHLGNKRYVMR
jgi:hypothetical protein